MTEQRKNTYEDSDFQQIIDEIEGFEAERRTILAEAAGKSSAIARKIADARKTATSLKIPKAVLTAVLKQRKLERQLEELAANVPDDLAEVYEDASGQFSWLKPEKDDETPAQTAARDAGKAAKARQEAEQEEGARILDEVVKH